MAFTEAGNDGVTNNTTPVTIVAAPDANAQRIVKTIIVFNSDTVSATVTVSLKNGAALRTLDKQTLAAGARMALNEILVLDATTKSIEVVLDAIVTTNQLEWITAYADAD